MSSRNLKFVVLAVLLFLTVLRFVNLDYDPPLYFTGHGQALLTDPYHLTFAARNKVLFDDWRPFDIHRWDVFKNSLISGAVYLSFSVAGVSRTAANSASLMLFLGGLLFFLFGFYHRNGDWGSLLIAFLLLMNSTLFFYGRLPFLENGLIFLSGLTFFVFVNYHDRLWGRVVSGALVALAALSGKLFGICLIGPVLISLIVRYRSRSVIPALAAIGGFLVAGAAYTIFFYGFDPAQLLDYYREHTVGIYGTPPGFASIRGFFHMLITFGGESGLWEYTPFLTFAAEICLVLCTLSLFEFKISDRRQMAVLFSFTWILVGVFTLMPFYYRPLRYGLFLFLPLAAVTAYGMRSVFTSKLRFGLSRKWLSIPLLFLIVWHMLTQPFMIFNTDGQKSQAGWEAMPLSGIIAAAIVAVLYLVFRRRRTLPRAVILIPLALLLLASGILQTTRIAKGLTRPGAYMEIYNAQLSDILDTSAVLAGPYMPALTIDNSLKGIIHSFGLSEGNDSFFSDYPVSHYVTEHNDWEEAVKENTFLRKSRQIAQMMIRERVIELYRLPGAKAPETDYETGVTYLQQGRIDSAIVCLTRFLDDRPRNILAGMQLVNARFASGDIIGADSILTGMLEDHPDNYFLHAFSRSAYLQFYNRTKNSEYRALSEYHEKRTRELNPAVREGTDESGAR